MGGLEDLQRLEPRQNLGEVAFGGPELERSLGGGAAGVVSLCALRGGRRGGVVGTGLTWGRGRTLRATPCHPPSRRRGPNHRAPWLAQAPDAAVTRLRVKAFEQLRPWDSAELGFPGGRAVGQPLALLPPSAAGVSIWESYLGCWVRASPAPAPALPPALKLRTSGSPRPRLWAPS